MEKTEKHGNVLDIVYIGVFSALIAVCAWISIPTTIPFTLQTLGIFTAIGVLGGKRGTVSILVYIILGMIGLPVFAGFNGGIGVLFNATGGYIIGFLASSLLMWGIEAAFGRSRIILILSMIAGLILCYAFGTAWFMLVYSTSAGAIGLGYVLGNCVIPFIIPDLIKICVAVFLTSRIKKEASL